MSNPAKPAVWRSQIMTVYRSNNLKRLANQTFDLLVIGGGIAGVGIAQDAAHRRLRVALVEKADFASGTTHASTKLLHGGLRYLEQFQFRLMYEALHERNRLAVLAPHLAEWLPFLIPFYSKGWKRLRIGIGLWLYDCLAGLPTGHLHRWISPARVLQMAPHLKAEGLVGAYLYYDCRTNDTRLTIEVLQSAIDGGAVVANYCTAVEMQKEKGRLTGAVVRDEVTGRTFPVRAKCVVNATGPWTDRVLDLDNPGTANLSPSKGVHILVPTARLPVTSAVLAPSPSGDGRFIFVLPWEGATLLGTTDTPFHGHPDTVTADQSDVDYIIEAANATFPDARLQRSDVLSTTAGLRPLIKAEANSTAALPREHKIWVSESGLISIAGGKLTTYRTMAAELTDLVVRQLGMPPTRCQTARLPLGVRRGQAIADLIRRHPELREPIVPGLPNSKGEAAYAAREEMAIYPEDILARRTRIALLDKQSSEQQRDEIAAIINRFGGGEQNVYGD
jgi:glycerol-3-phosphate dehydrogenase